MPAASMTHSQLAALLVEGCLGHIAGKVAGKMPVDAIPATGLERASVGLPQGGQTMFYPLGGDTGVYIDLSGAVATVWYMGGDYERGLTAVEDVLKRAQGKQLKDDAGAAPKQRVRSYQVELGGGRLAHVVIEYVERGAAQERFLVRVGAQVRRG
ncbi:hypothetical protein [Candidatus Viadribacter manganicus]|uniref:Uncharacterized protein n=1 Tax=Candidatus Viadribacter manganicus TaxID=1759059 RepID=A0A1B1AI31_9PROT|nr:hypothetical protein [Candidatus Viadribacter manganicus]ANP46191.1 hypothetical protein ATE48_09800 [Candidatus Viadribacter manganicus]